jgi:predicted transcriptional regulator
MSGTDTSDLTALTVDFLSAYVSNHKIPTGELAGLIQSTHGALARIGQDPVEVASTEVEYVAAVSIRKSLSSKDHLLSLIDGKPYKTLKRHLSSHGLTPAEYRLRYKLAADYPMVARSYSEHRRSIAVKMGLGQHIKGGNSVTPGAVIPTELAEPAAAEKAVQAPTSKKPGRKPRSEAPTAAKRGPKRTASAESASKSALPSASEKPTRRRLSIKVAQVESGQQTPNAVKQKLSGS